MNAKTGLILLAIVSISASGFIAYRSMTGTPQDAEPPFVLDTTEGNTPDGMTAATEEEQIAADVKAALIEKHGESAEAMTVSVSTVDGEYATGAAKEEFGGGMWFAAKVGDRWELAWDGNGTIGCADIGPYEFPVSLVPECWDEDTQELVVR